MLDYKLDKLQVCNFRNLENQIIEFGPGINYILGENGNGKTNLLEAVNVLVTNKSFRKNARFPQYLSMDGEEPEIIFSSVFKEDNRKTKVYSGKISKDENNWFLDGKEYKKKLDLGIVFINPFDSYGFHTMGSTRRAWFDQYISFIDAEYKKVLNRYQKQLRFRNSLLSKKPPKFLEQIEALDIEFSESSLLLTNKRIQFLKELSPISGKTFQQIFSEVHDLDIQLDSKVMGMNSNQIYLYMRQNIEKDTVCGFTTYGIHKDDYLLLFDQINSYDYCSLGQQKMSYLSLVFAYISLFRYKFNSYPIVLIDDISGELDRSRWGKLIEFLKQSKFQVLITTANEKFKEELEKIENARKIHVKDGTILQ